PLLPQYNYAGQDDGLLEQSAEVDHQLFLLHSSSDLGLQGMHPSPVLAPPPQATHGSTQASLCPPRNQPGGRQAPTLISLNLLPQSPGLQPSPHDRAEG